MTKASKFLKGTLLLSAAGVIVKLLGAVYRIPIVSIIGDEGMSYYQTAYPIYSLLLTVSTTGLPVAVAKMISERVSLEDYINADRIFKFTAGIMIFLGAATAFSVFLFADKFSEFIKNPGVYYSLIALIPALLVSPVLSSFRGFFQGRQNMLPTAISQVSEQVGRVILGLFFAVILLPKGIAMAAGGASLGGSLGAVFGILTMIFYYLRRKPQTDKEILSSKHKRIFSNREIFRTLILIAVPITLGAAILPLTDSVDAMIFPSRLGACGFTLEEANKLHGNLKGMAQTLINFPLMFLYAVSVSLVPSISETVALEDDEKKKTLISSGFRLSSVFSFPCAAGLCALAFPIIHLLYAGVSISSQRSAGSLLSVSAFQLIFLGIIQTSAAILQGIGHPIVPAFNMLIGAAIKMILSYLLMGIREINIYGMSISSLVCFFVVALLDLRSVEKFSGVRVEKKEIFIKPLLASSVMGIAVFLINGLLNQVSSSRFMVFFTVIFGAVFYFAVLLLLKIFREEDFLILPKGEKVVERLKKAGLM